MKARKPSACWQPTAAARRPPAALARSDSAQTVSIPIRREDGTSARATLLVGPASQLVAEDLEEDEDLGDEIRDDVLVARLSRLRTAR